MFGKTCRGIAGVLLTVPFLIAFSAGPAGAAPQTLTVDLAAPTGPVLRGANGALYAMSDDGVPGDNLLRPLKIATIGQPPPGVRQHPNGDSLLIADAFFRTGGRDIYVYTQDIYEQWPYEDLGIDDYLPKLKKIAQQIATHPKRDKFIYNPINEPDFIWYNLGSSDPAVYEAGKARFFAEWKAIVEAIREIHPGARISGPGTAVYSHRFLADFLPWAKANGLLPDVMIWHELSPQSLARFSGNYRDYRALEASLGISPLPINISEYANRRDLSVPGQLVQWVGMFEDAKVYADMPYWDVAGNLAGHAVQTNVPNGGWWFFRAYAGLSGQTVKVTPPRPETIDTLQGVAALDQRKKQAQVLLGGTAEDTDVVIAGIPAWFGGKVQVTVSEMPWSGYEGSARPPQVLSRTAYPRGDGTVTVPLAGLHPMSAYRIMLTPDGGGGASPTAPAVPWRASYEAEDAAITNGRVGTHGTVANANGYAASGTKDVGFLTQPDSKVVFSVEVPTSGTYHLDIFYGNQYGQPDNGSPTQQVLRVDGANPRFVHYPQTLNWQYRGVKRVPLTLTAGTHTISLAASDPELGTSLGEVSLDKIDLSDPVAESTYDATMAEISGNAAYDYSPIGETGTGSVRLDRGSTATFDAYAPADGYFTIKTTYRGGGTLSLNGARVGELAPRLRLFLHHGINRIDLTAGGSALTVQNLKVIGAGDTRGLETYEAEHATLAGTAAVRDGAFASGGRFVAYGGGADNTLTFTVRAAKPGRHTVLVHYSHNDRRGTHDYNTNIMSRVVRLSVNGGAPRTYTMRNTFSENDFWSFPITIALARGRNTLTFENPDGNAPNTDRIQVAPVIG
jgi:hypothetical protein